MNKLNSMTSVAALVALSMVGAATKFRQHRRRLKHM